MQKFAEISEIWNSAAKWDPNRLHPPSQSIVTCSERNGEDRRILVAPLAPPLILGGYLIHRGHSPKYSGAGKELKRMNSLLSPLDLKA